MEERIVEFPHCGRCCATFYLDSDKAWYEQQGVAWAHAPSDDNASQVAANEVDDAAAVDDPYL